MARHEVADQFTFGDPHETLTDSARREALRNTGLLNRTQHAALDAITRLAAHTLGATKSQVSLVEPHRQFFPSVSRSDGLPDGPFETPISHSLCQYVVINDAPLIVEDATRHPVLHRHPAVIDDGLVAYAGFPVRDPSGQVLGALCVVDVRPHPWTDQQLAALRDLTLTVETTIALGLSTRANHLDHERLMRVLDGAVNTMVVIADAEGVVTTMNHTAVVLIGSAMSSWGGRFTLGDLAGIAVPNGPEVGPGEARDWTLKSPDEGERIVSVRISTLRDVHEHIDGYILVGDDVSAHRQAEEILRVTAQKQADLVHRLETHEAERSAFIGTASHELRTPLTSILGFVELLLDDSTDALTAAQRDLLDRVDRNSQRLLHLVEELLSLAGDTRATDPVRIEIEAGSLAHRAWDSLGPHLAGRALDASIEVSPESPVISGDPAQLGRALHHLLVNAVKFTPDGGSVRLAVHPHGTGVVFDVSDTGPGIPEDEQAAVFEPFHRTRSAQDQAVPGSGLGLASVRRIAKSHGGEISLESRHGHGTTVRIVIP